MSKSKSKILYVKIGNSRVRAYLNRRLVADVPSGSLDWSKWRNIFKNSHQVYLVSVVPSVTQKFRKILSDLRKPHHFVQPSDLSVAPRYKTLGIDRLLNASTAWEIFGRPLVIFDFGTALTVDWIDSSGRHLGGYIVAGPNLALHSLCIGTALLPKVIRRDLDRRKGLGTTTEDCISKGLAALYFSFCNDQIDRAKKQWGSKTMIIFTGGSAPKRFSSTVLRIPDLTFRGLRQIALK